MLSFTLDTNCLIDLEEDRDSAPSVRAVVDAHRDGRARVAVVFSSASERSQPDRPEAANLAEFTARLARLDLAHVDVLPALGIWDFSFWDGCLWSDDGPGAALQDQLQALLFPDIDFARPVFDKRWRNAMCDVQAIWAHIYHRRDIFVTGDGNFHKQTKEAALISLGAGRILRAPEAANLL